MKVKQLFFVAVTISCVALIAHSTESKTASVQSTSSMPLPFTKNMGQWPDSILFRASANGATMWFTKNGIWYQFFRKVEKSDVSATAIGASAVGGPSTGRVPVNLWAADVPSAPSESHGNPPERWATRPRNGGAPGYLPD